MKLNLKHLIVIIITSLILSGAYFYFSTRNTSWEIGLKNTASSSSCRAVELNGDDILDIVIGAGSIEHEPTKNGVIAINGKNGNILWRVSCRDQVVGSAIFQDVTNDGIKDVFIGGRKNQLWCINGVTGEIIWEYQKSIENLDKKDKRLLNFFNPQFIPDQDNDGYSDIIISFGGFVHAKPHDHERPPGHLFILSSKNGKILSNSTMPDNMETYFSPVVYDFKKDNDPFVIFGSGGETINGSLYIIRLSFLMNGEIKKASKLADGFSHGFISSPILCDITNDGIKDFTINSFDGRVIAFDGKTFNKIWQVKVGYKVATFSSLAPIETNGDGIPDFFGSYGDGIWNDYRGTVQVLIDGKTGKILKRFKIGAFQYSSPLACDLTKDGHEDILLHTNETTLSKRKDKKGNLIPTYSNKLTLFDLHNDKIFTFGKEFKGSNLLSTPLIIDLDSNGKTDILSCRQVNENNIFSNEKLIINRKEIDMKLTKTITWGAYMGSSYNSIK